MTEGAPCEQKFLSCIASSVYEVIRMINIRRLTKS